MPDNLYLCYPQLYLNKLFPLSDGVWKWSRFLVYNFLLMVIPQERSVSLLLQHSMRILFQFECFHSFIHPISPLSYFISADNGGWSLTFWFVPVGISLLLGVFFFILALIRNRPLR